jgi:hypothetical protein
VVVHVDDHGGMVLIRDPACASVSQKVLARPHGS